MVVFVRQEPALSMMFSLYVTLVSFSSWHPQSVGESQRNCLHCMVEFRHAALMGTQACRNMVARGELIGVAVLVIIGAVFSRSHHQEACGVRVTPEPTPSALTGSRRQ